MTLRRTLWRALLAGLLVLPAAAADPAGATTLRVALSSDAATLDPHAFNSGPTAVVIRQIYEPLVMRGPDGAKAPGLAMSWALEEPTRWRFRLRPEVRFHDGSRFTSDDVVFSIGRALAPTSDTKIYVAGIREARRIDDLTVDIVTEAPDAVLPDKLARVFIMDAEWAGRHGVEQPQDFRGREETHAVRNTNGTGPYRLTRREPDSRTELVRFDGWWNAAQTGNVTRVEFLPIANDATRISALAAGDIDLVLDLPPQAHAGLQRDARVKLMVGPENRTIFLGMHQQRDELPDSDVKGRNPFRDARVRRAFYHAIDIEAIRRQTMRGLAMPTGSMWAPSTYGYAVEEDVRLPLDRARARQLLAEAGYPNGFSVPLDCPNNRYVSDEQICLAVAAMLAQVGVRVTVSAQPFGKFAVRLQRRESSFFLAGWAVATFDALTTLQAIIRSPGKGADGTTNFAAYSNPAVDALIDAVKMEIDPNRRLEKIRQAHRLHNDEVGHIPLHNQMIVWAMRPDVQPVMLPENQLEVKWVRITE